MSEETADASVETTESTETTAEQVDTSSEATTSETAEQSVEQSDGQEKESNTDTPAEDVTIAVPEGLEAFKEDFDQFSNDVNAYLKANPKASVSDVLNEVAQRQARLVAESSESAANEWNQRVQGWEAEVKADPDIGGAAFEENLAKAKASLEAFGSEDLGKFLDESGLGSHPGLIRYAIKAGAAISDAKVSADTASTSSDVGLQNRYPKSTG